MIAVSATDSTRYDAVREAARSLVRVVQGDARTVVTLPVFYPSGAAAAVEVTSAGRNLFDVSDSGLAHHEIETIGAEHLFGRNAAAVADLFGISAGRRTLYWRANIDQLAGAIADVGAASVQLAQRIFERVAQRNEAEIEAKLYQRLVGIFGVAKVEQEATIAGASAHKWRVSALVHLDRGDMAFEAVSNHHSSVYSSSTMFHDLALLERRPISVAVVRNKAEMGDYLRILAQAANVIQDDAADGVLRRLAA